MNPIELIPMLAIRRRNSLTRWFMEDETGTLSGSRVAITVGVVVGLAVLKKAVKHFRNRDDG